MSQHALKQDQKNLSRGLTQTNSTVISLKNAQKFINLPSAGLSSRESVKINNGRNSENARGKKQENQEKQTIRNREPEYLFEEFKKKQKLKAEELDQKIGKMPIPLVTLVTYKDWKNR